MQRTIVTDRLVLRPFSLADADTVLQYLGDLGVSKWLSRVPHPFTRADLRLMNEDGSERWPDLAAITEDGQIVGAVGSSDHLGYWLGRPFWARGIAGEAVGAMVEHLFSVQARRRIQSCYFEGNVASARILQKLGFRETGRDIQHCQARGEKIPNVHMALAKSDWEARQ